MLIHSNNGLNNAEFMASFGDSQLSMTMKTLFSAIALNNRVALKLSLKMVFITELKFLRKSSTIFLDKDYAQMTGSKILPPYLVSLK
ncbi:MAG: hypothetical protein V7K83_13445 [Nostoc sp.]